MRPVLNDFYDPFIIDEYIPESSWRIYPNPVSNGTVHIENNVISHKDLEEGQTRVMVYDLLGRTMLNLPYSETINTAKLPDGLYLLQILSQDRSVNHIHKILIK